MPVPPTPVPPRLPIVPRSSRRPERKAKAPAPASAPVPAPRLPMPHERDETTGQVDPQPSDVIRRAKRDLDAGLVDTDMRATPGLDAERREALVPTKQPGRGRPRRP
jgi:hypothetical protein